MSRTSSERDVKIGSVSDVFAALVTPRNTWAFGKLCWLP
jgi:hypothetical protein